MSNEEDAFQKADNAFPLQGKGVDILPPDNLTSVPKNMMEHRDQLVRKYHNGKESLSARLKAEGRENVESLVMALVDEVIKETDNLLGNELIALQGGNLRDNTIISEKRATVLAQAIKAVQAKQLFEQEHGLDLDSPSMKVVFMFFMSKAKATFSKLNYKPEVSDVFFRNLAAGLDNWKKELREELNAMNGAK